MGSYVYKKREVCIFEKEHEIFLSHYLMGKREWACGDR